MSNKVVVLASGGLDSNLLIMHYATLNYDIYPVFIDYGQVAMWAEKAHLECFLYGLGVKGYNIHPIVVLTVDMRFSQTFIVGGSNKVRAYLESRNHVLLMLASAYAESKEIYRLAIGIHLPDENSEAYYPDASEQFVDAVNHLNSFTNEVIIEAPFAHMRKRNLNMLANFYKQGYDIDVKENSISCLNPTANNNPCGKCIKCSETTC
jgi:7-cyano-7-deazaguanine synthase